MLHGVYAVVNGEVVQGVSAQDGMPGCKIGCRIGPNPKIRCKLDSGQDANTGVQDGVLTFVSYFTLHFQVIHFEHLYKAKHVFNTLKALSSFSGWSTLKLIKLNSFRLINFNGFPNNSFQRVRLTNYMRLMKAFRAGEFKAVSD